MINLIIELIILTTATLILLYAAHYDIKHRQIQLKTILAILILGITYTITQQTTPLQLITIQAIITMIFIIPTIAGMGWGDMYLLWSLGLYITSQTMLQTFLIAFIITASILTIYYIKKNKITKEQLKTFYFPLIPAVTVGFITANILRLLL